MSKPIPLLSLLLLAGTLAALWLADRSGDGTRVPDALEQSNEAQSIEAGTLDPASMQSVRLELSPAAAGAAASPTSSGAAKREALASEAGVVLRIEGQVRAERDGARVAGAQIAFLGRRRLPEDSASRRDPEVATTSDPLGHYVLNVSVDELGSEAAALRPWMLEASGAGYLRETRPLLEHALAPGATARNFDFALTSLEDAGALHGLLKDELAREIEGATVRLQEQKSFHWRLREEPEAIELRTAHDGSFRCAGLRSGTYSVHVERAGHVELACAGIEVFSRDDRDLGILVARALDVRTARVRGLLRDGDERPLPGLNVKIGALATTTDEQGSFDLPHLLPGRVSMEISFGSSYRAASRLTLEPSADLRLEAELAIGAHRLGGLVTSAGSPLPGAVLGTSYPLVANVAGLEPSELRFAQSFSAHTGRDGRFAFASLPAATSPLYVEHRALAVDRTFEAPAIDDERLALELVPGPLIEIHGTVRDRAGVSVPGAIVAPVRPASDRERGLCDERGAYRLWMHLSANQGIGVFASRDGYATADRWLGLEEAAGTGRIEIDWVLAPNAELGTLVGRITGTSGEWIDAYVVVTPKEEGRDDEWFAEVDSRGEFHLPGLPSGTLAARFCALGREEIARDVAIAARGVERVEVELPLPVVRERTLLVRDADGRPVAGVEARLSGPSFATGFEGRSDAQGRLQLALPLETDTITLRHERYARHVIAVTMADSEPTEVSITLRRGGERIAGSVLDRMGEPVPEVLVRLVEQESGTPAIDEVKFTRESGSFAFENLPAGEFLLEVKGPDGQVWSRRVSAGSGDVEVRIARA